MTTDEKIRLGLLALATVSTPSTIVSGTGVHQYGVKPPYMDEIGGPGH